MTRVPLATYRLQINPSFGFSEARRVCGYLHRLGVSNLYASPLLAAREGSEHGYDVTDPTRLNPELGTEGDFESLTSRMSELGLGLLLDIVPNHMSTASANAWWTDVLARGRSSRFARFFAIDWDAQDGRLLLPILGDPYGEVLERGELKLEWTQDGPRVRYWERSLPLNPDTSSWITEPTVRALNGDPADPASFDDLHELLEQQPYRLAWWRTANREVNYRRFFDIGDLISVRQEDPDVFQATHVLINELVARGIVTGLRVDHVDGLRDPRGYLSDLEAATGRTYVVVEKILAADESLPEDWPTAGTTGYEFLNVSAAIFADVASEKTLDRLFVSWTCDDRPFAEVVHEAKRQVIDELFGSDVARLMRGINERARADRRARDLGPTDLREALVEITSWLSVYRTYAADGEMSRQDAGRIESAVTQTIKHDPALEPAAAFCRRLLLEAGDLTMAWQQLTGPAMAKGHEDTALYRYVRLLSRNAVGGEPSEVALPVQAFHRFCADRARRADHSLSTTSTHDTKRSEDVRARIDVLTEIAREWADRVGRWRDLNEPLRRHDVPSPHEELLLYQTLVGTWPVDGDHRGYSQRISDYMMKAAREAKAETSWLHPDPAHEQALRGFVRRALAPSNEAFRSDLDDLTRTVSFHGAINSLAQTVLKIAAPGVPDTYQGTELWDLSLVDPDNRRPVDYDLRTSLLDGIVKDASDDRAALIRSLLEGWTDGRIKLFTMWTGLHLRRERPDLFTHGSYSPLEASGPRARHLVAFARHHERSWTVTVVPRLTVRLGRGRWPIGRRAWRTTTLRLPSRAPSRWVETFTGRELSTTGGMLLLSDALSSFPVCLLKEAR